MIYKYSVDIDLESTYNAEVYIIDLVCSDYDTIGTFSFWYSLAIF